ncbi:MAG: RNA-binding S4 domain-containing protein [Bacilli bacterium]
MRLDKYLKVSRIIKRRTVAKEVCDQGRVQVNGQTVKASYDVAVGDEMGIAFGNRDFVVRVTTVAEHAKKEDAKEMYEILVDQKREVKEDFEE